MVDAFEDSGLRVQWLIEPNDVTAESMLATKRFSKCFGVTSSTLLYGPGFVSDVEFISVGAQTLAILRSIGRGVDELVTIESDLELFDAVSSAVSAKR